VLVAASPSAHPPPDREAHPACTLLRLPAYEAAPRLIGWEVEAHGVRARITEVEAYQGQQDRACHAARGRTARTAVLYARAGTLYVYRCYGMHWMLNLVCDRDGEPAAVLVRSVEIISGGPVARARRALSDAVPLRDGRTIANGPGKVCQALALDGGQHGVHMHDRACALTLHPPQGPVGALARSARIGVDYAGPRWSRRRWRWWLRGFPVAEARTPG
jgi:DNA-3-methyladenine glycosylase